MKIVEGMMNLIKKLFDEADTVNGFCHLGKRLNGSCGCEAAVTARIRIGCIKFRDLKSCYLEIGFPCG